MNKIIYNFLLILVVSLITALIRFLPFILFPEGKEPPKIITYLSNVLPCAVMGMLVIYCLKNVSLVTFPFALPELISIILVVILYVYKRNTLLSILSGTVCYMIIVQVFV